VGGLGLVHSLYRAHRVVVPATAWHLVTKDKKVKADIALHGNPISEVRDVTCHIGSHIVAYHLTQVNAPRLTPAIQAGSRFTYPRGMES